MRQYEEIMKEYVKRRNFFGIEDYKEYLKDIPEEEIEEEIKDIITFAKDNYELDVEDRVRKDVRKIKGIMDYEIKKVDIPEIEPEQIIQERKEEQEDEVKDCVHDLMFIKKDAQFKYFICRKCLKIETEERGQSDE